MVFVHRKSPDLRVRLLPLIAAFFCVGILLPTADAQNDEVAEVNVPWKPGDMIANPAANLVYVINETDGDLLAISTQSGSVVAHKRLSYSPQGAQLFLLPDASALYLSVPSNRKLYTLSPADLSEIAVTNLEVEIGSFVIAADGFLYSVGKHEGLGDRKNVVKLNASSGAELERMTNSSVHRNYLFRLNSSGNAFYVMAVGTSGLPSSVSEFITSAGAPIFAAMHYTNASNDQDLSVDDANDRLYRSSGGIYGLSVWNISGQTQEFWTFDGPAYGTAVTQLPGSDTVWAGAGDPYDGLLMEFNKATGASGRVIKFGKSNSDYASGSLMAGSLEITSSGRMLFAKEDWTGHSTTGVDGHLYYICITDILAANIDYTPSTQAPVAPYDLTASDEEDPDRVELSWKESIRATGYQIFRNTTNDSHSATQIASLAASFTDYTDHTAATGQVYYYWVRATNGAGNSPFSLGEEGSVLPPPDAPSNYSATDGLYVDRIRISRDSVPGITGARIYRSTTDQFATATEIANSTSTYYYDWNVVAGQIYFYWSRLENEAGMSPLSSSDSGYAGYSTPPDSAPSSVSASDGVSIDHVNISWTGVSDARSYEILRHTSNDSGAATVIGTVSATLYIDSYTDSSAIPEVIYYYWIRAKNTAGTGPLSSSDSGFRAQFQPPAAVSGVSATDGAYTTHVRISWSSVTYADQYTVYRNSSDNSGSATAIQTTTSTYFDDAGPSAAAGTIYHYWVTASNTAGTSTLSSSDPGFAALPPQPANPPTSVSASDGTSDSRIAVTWSSVQYASEYEVFRNPIDDSASALLLGSTESTSYTDHDVPPGQTYFYWVKAKNSTGTTDFSTADSGYTSLSRPDHVYATNDLFDSMIRVTWNSVPGAARYRIFRNTGPNPSFATLIATVDAPNLRYEDSNASAGQSYYYWLKSETADGQTSQFSNTDEGRRSSAPASASAFLGIDDPTDVDFDLTRKRAYITTTDGIVEVYDLAQQRILNAEWNTDGGLAGADLTPDDQLLVLAQTRLSPTTGEGQVTTIAPATGAIQSFEYLLNDQYEDGSYDVVALEGDKALITTGFSGSGWVPFRSLDLVTGIFTVLDPGQSASGNGGTVRNDSMLTRTPDRSLVVLQEGTIPNGLYFSFNPTSGTFGTAGNVEGFQYRGSVSPDGSLLAIVNALGAEIHSLSDGSLSHSFSGLKSGLLFDPVRSFLYAVDVDEDLIRVFSTSNWQEVFTIDIERDIGDHFSKYGEGHLVMDPSGDWLALTFEDGVKLFNMADYATAPPPAPASVSATDNTTADGISITWALTSNTSSYRVLRSGTNDPVSAVEIAAGLTATSFLDDSITAGSVFYYWVQGTNLAGDSPLSSFDSGERRVGPPANFTASDGIHFDKIALSWDPSPSAISYTLFRSETDDPATATQLATGISATSYNDLTANLGTDYYYWIMAVSNNGSSEMSASVTGSRQLPGPEDLSINLESSASIGLSWTAAPQATGYTIYRGISENPENATEIGQTSSLNFTDTTAIHGQVYQWFVQASDGANASRLESAVVSGSRIFAKPNPFSASQNRNDYVYLNWTAVTGTVDAYEIARSEVDDISTATIFAQRTGTSVSDSSGQQDQSIYYWVRAISPTTTGEWSGPRVGKRQRTNVSQWAKNHGLTDDDTHPGMDPDNDGDDNQSEWLSGTDPNDPGSFPTVILRIQNISGEDYLTLSYLRLVGGTDNGPVYEHDWGNYHVSGRHGTSDENWTAPCLATDPPEDLAPAADGYEWGCVRLDASIADQPVALLKLHYAR